MRTKKTCPKTPGGFSLLELLLVMTLLPIVFFSVYSNFSTGFKIWARVVRQTPEEDVDIFYYKARKDLENMQRFAAIPFDGDKEAVSFAATVQAPPELGGASGIGQVSFTYDPDHHTVLRESKDYSQLYEEHPGTQSVLLKNVASFELSYFSKEPMENAHSWSDSWKPDPKKLPLAVRISFTLEGVPEKQERTVFIPVGGLVQ